MKINIAIDGPSGSGKGTTAKLLAQRLGYNYLDTGAMYRAVALELDRRGVSPEGFEERYLEGIEIDFRDNEIILNGKKVEHLIRTPKINSLSSTFSKIPPIRRFLSAKQKEIVKDKGYVAEGRDIGSVIMPGAELKIYLNADLEIRARRRLEDFRKQDDQISFEEVVEILRAKDHQDMNREMDPLRKLPDAIEVDTSDMTIEAQVERIRVLAEEKINSL